MALFNKPVVVDKEETTTDILAMFHTVKAKLDRRCEELKQKVGRETTLIEAATARRDAALAEAAHAESVHTKVAEFISPPERPIQ